MIRLPQQALLRVSGQDKLRFLQGLVTSDLSTLEKEDGKAVYAAFLNPKGRVLGDAHFIQKDQDVFIDCHQSAMPVISKHLKRYKLRSKVQLQELDPLYHQVWASLSDDSPGTVHQDMVKYKDSRAADFGWRYLKSSTDALPAVENQPGMDFNDDQEYNTWRLLCGIAEGEEIVDSIPAESNLDLLNGICFTKGCYIGQELTARTQFKGLVRKRIVPLLCIPSNDVTAELEAKKLIQEARTGSIASVASRAASTLVGDSTSILSAKSNKRVGKIISTSSTVGIGLALLRLEAFQDPDYLLNLHTEDRTCHVLPYRSAWWPTLDKKNGKPVAS